MFPGTAIHHLTAHWEKSPPLQPLAYLVFVLEEAVIPVQFLCTIHAFRAFSYTPLDLLFSSMKVFHALQLVFVQKMFRNSFVLVDSDCF